jgi:Tfp pilus assembly protein FimT
MRHSSSASGFSTVELVVIVSVIGILLSIGVPSISIWQTNYALRRAARDLYSTLQLAKLTAVKQNRDCAIVFQTSATPGRYFLCTAPGPNGIWDGPAVMGGDDVAIKTVSLADYKGNVNFGKGTASNDIQGSGSPPADPVGYASPTDVAIFSSAGTIINPGVSGSYVYLSNGRGDAYGVGTPSIVGSVLLRRWSGSKWR